MIGGLSLRAALGRAFRVGQALRVGGAQALGRDLAAGLTLAAIAIPEQMATARLGGFSPEVGLIAFVAASVGFALFGRNPLLSAGADSTITPIFAGTLAALAASAGERVQLAAALAIAVGVLVAAAGIFKLGRIADLLSKPVITGFLTGIAAHIALSQAPSVMGVAAPTGEVWERLRGLVAAAPAARPLALAVGLGTFAVVCLAEEISPRIPGALMALAAATAATWAFGLEARGLKALGAVQGGFPAPRWPGLPIDALAPLAGLALMLALVAMVQTGATTRAFNPEDADVNGDFVGLGAAGILAGLFGAFPVNASPPRTALTAEAGGGSQWAGLTAAATVVLLLLFGTGLLAHAPAAALAGVLLFIAQRLVHVTTFRDMLRRAPEEFLLALATAALIVVLPIETGVAAAIFISLAHGVFTIARARLIPFEHVPGTTIWWPVWPTAPAPAGDGGEQIPGVTVMGFQAPLTFLNAHEFHRAVLDRVGPPPPAERLRLFVLEASGVIEVDFTAAEILKDLIGRLRGQGVDMAVARLESLHARADFDRFGVTEALGADHLFHSVAQAVAALAAAKPPAPKPAVKRRVRTARRS